MSKPNYLDRTEKETFYALGKVNKSKKADFFKGFTPKLEFTKMPEDAYTFRNYEGAKEGLQSHSLLSKLKIFEITLETKKTYTIGIEKE